METVIRRAREAIEPVQSSFCRRNDISVSLLSRIENGTYRAGELVRQRVSRMLQRPEADLFDSRGWPIEASPDVAG